MVAIKNLSFGYHGIGAKDKSLAEREHDVVWGARALWQGETGGSTYVDLLPDRCDLLVEHGEDPVMQARKANFVATLNGKTDHPDSALTKGALAMFCEAIEQRDVWPSNDVKEPTILRFRGITFACCTQRSYGYLYISAWSSAPGEADTDINAMLAADPRKSKKKRCTKCRKLVHAHRGYERIVRQWRGEWPHRHEIDGKSVFYCADCRPHDARPYMG